MYGENMRRFILKAHELGMTSGDYAFIAERLVEGDIFGNQSWKRGDSSDEVRFTTIQFDVNM